VRECRRLECLPVEWAAAQVLGPAAVRALELAAAQVLGPAVAQALEPVAVRALGPAAVRALGPAAVRALGPAVVRALEPVAALAPVVTRGLVAQARPALEQVAVRRCRLAVRPHAVLERRVATACASTLRPTR
jgi:hypothetical protein